MSFLVGLFLWVFIPENDSVLGFLHLIFARCYPHSAGSQYKKSISFSLTEHHASHEGDQTGGGGGGGTVSDFWPHVRDRVEGKNDDVSYIGLDVLHLRPSTPLSLRRWKQSVKFLCGKTTVVLPTAGSLQRADTHWSSNILWRDKLCNTEELPHRQWSIPVTAQCAKNINKIQTFPLDTLWTSFINIFLGFVLNLFWRKFLWKLYIIWRTTYKKGLSSQVCVCLLCSYIRTNPR